jgi:hypothetical protein
MIPKEHQAAGRGARRDAPGGTRGNEAANSGQRQYSHGEGDFRCPIAFIKMKASGKDRHGDITPEANVQRAAVASNRRPREPGKRCKGNLLRVAKTVQDVAQTRAQHNPDARARRPPVPDVFDRSHRFGITRGLFKFHEPPVISAGPRRIRRASRTVQFNSKPAIAAAR